MDPVAGRREVLEKLLFGLLAFSFSPLFAATKVKASRNPPKTPRSGTMMTLPPPKAEGQISVEQAIKARRTVRSFGSRSLTLDQLSQLLWAAQGITEDGGYKRAAPSAGALYPMDVYAVVGADLLKGVAAGVYRYVPTGHKISLIWEGDIRKELAKAALSQMWIADAPLDLVITAQYDRAASKYGKRAVRYAMIEAGHIGQNIFLQAEALGLGAGIVGAFDDKDVIRVMKIPKDHEPLLIMPVGYRG
jgi:SagB-type dehydrogenase family enzyme